MVGIVNHPGVFSEYICLPNNNLHVIADEISDREAVFIEPLAASVEILEQIHIPPASKIAVVGDGKLALLIVQVLQLHGNPVCIFGKHRQKLVLASKFGASSSEVRNSNLKSFDFVVEASGSPSGFELALDLLKPRGTMVLKSTYHGGFNYNSERVVVDEITIVGSRCGPFEPAIRLLALKRVDVKSLITCEYPLSQALDAFAKAQQKETLKILLKIVS